MAKASKNDNAILEKVQDAGPKTMDFYETSIEQALFDFAAEQDYASPKDFSQSVWNASLIYANKRCIPKSDLKQHSLYNIPNTSIKSNYNAYDLDIVNALVDYYIYLCLKYDKECSIIGFSLLSGISYETIEEWKRGDKVTSRSSVIAKKITSFREESLSNKLASGKGNPVGVIAILNHHFQWASPYSGRETVKVSLSIDQIREQIGIGGVAGGQAAGIETSIEKVSEPETGAQQS